MSKREAISRYHLIIAKLRRGPATFDEISNYLDIESTIQSYDYRISDRTFKRDIKDIFSIYNIEIKYDFSKKVYVLVADDKTALTERVFEAFDTLNALNITDELSNFIYIQRSKPKGTEHLYGIIHAIKNHLQILFSYQKFWADNITRRKVEPYALKEFENRWYVIAKDTDDNVVKCFALDRLFALEITKTVSSSNYNVSDHFKHCYGIMSPDSDAPEEVILSFTPFQGKYIKSLPLHDSQQILKDDSGELQIKLMLFITLDFMMKIL